MTVGVVPICPAASRLLKGRLSFRTANGARSTPRTRCASSRCGCTRRALSLHSQPAPRRGYRLALPQRAPAPGAEGASRVAREWRLAGRGRRHGRCCRRSGLRFETERSKAHGNESGFQCAARQKAKGGRFLRASTSFPSAPVRTGSRDDAASLVGKTGAVPSHPSWSATRG
jgi:hypothetical protein